MPTCAPNELTTLSFSVLLLGITRNANCPKWWMVPDPLMQTKGI